MKNKPSISYEILHKLIGRAPKIETEIGNQSVKLYLVTITPEIASEIIENSRFRNRKTRQNKIQKYVTYMQEGKWLVKATIEFSGNGELTDGHHRMKAVAASGVTCSFFAQVVPEKEVEAHNVSTDTGLQRTLPDFLEFRHVPNSARVAQLLTYEVNERVTQNPNQKVLKEKEEYYAVYKEIGEEALKHAFDLVPKGLSTTLGVSRGFIDWITHRMCQAADPQDVGIFLLHLREGTGMANGDAALVLREKLISMRDNRKSGTIIEPVAQMHMMAKAWRRFVSNQNTKESDIRWHPTENWPGIAGEVR